MTGLKVYHDDTATNLPRSVAAIYHTLFVAEDGGGFNGSVPPDGMQVAPTKRATRNLHHGLPFTRTRILEGSQAQWLARTFKDGR